MNESYGNDNTYLLFNRLRLKELYMNPWLQRASYYFYSPVELEWFHSPKQNSERNANLPHRMERHGELSTGQAERKLPIVMKKRTGLKWENKTGSG